MTTVFNGREFAARKETELKKEVVDLKKKGVTPKLVSILVGDNPGSILYTSLKKKAAERIGAELEVRRWKMEVGYGSLIDEIRRLNRDKRVHGIMVQLPLPKSIKYHVSSIINSIAPEKDVDGLRKNSPFVPATAKAVLQILDESSVNKLTNPRVAVVGASGMVGTRLVKELESKDFQVFGIDLTTSYKLPDTKTADVLISTTGVPGLIKADMVKEGAVVIDVGSPKGDVDPSTSLRTSFFTPVPGGVGPVTIVSLLENLVIATKNSI